MAVSCRTAAAQCASLLQRGSRTTRRPPQPRLLQMLLLTVEHAQIRVARKARVGPETARLRTTRSPAEP